MLEDRLHCASGFSQMQLRFFYTAVGFLQRASLREHLQYCVPLTAFQPTLESVLVPRNLNAFPSYLRMWLGTNFEIYKYRMIWCMAQAVLSRMKLVSE